MNAIDLAIHLGRGEYDWIPEAMEMLNKQYDRIKELEAWQKHDIELAEAIGFDRAHKLQADRIAELEKDNEAFVKIASDEHKIAVEQEQRVLELEKSAEPVAWMDKRTNKCVVFINTPPSDNWIPLYTTPQQQLIKEKNT